MSIHPSSKTSSSPPYQGEMELDFKGILGFPNQNSSGGAIELSCLGFYLQKIRFAMGGKFSAGIISNSPNSRITLAPLLRLFLRDPVQSKVVPFIDLPTPQIVHQGNFLLSTTGEVGVRVNLTSLWFLQTTFGGFYDVNREEDFAALIMGAGAGGVF